MLFPLVLGGEGRGCFDRLHATVEPLLTATHAYIKATSVITARNPSPKLTICVQNNSSIHTQIQLLCKLLKFIDNSHSEQEPGNIKTIKATPI